MIKSWNLDNVEVAQRDVSFLLSVLNYTRLYFSFPIPLIPFLYPSTQLITSFSDEFVLVRWKVHLGHSREKPWPPD